MRKRETYRELCISKISEIEENMYCPEFDYYQELLQILPYCKELVFKYNINMDPSLPGQITRSYEAFRMYCPAIEVMYTLKSENRKWMYIDLDMFLVMQDILNFSPETKLSDHFGVKSKFPAETLKDILSNKNRNKYIIYQK